MICNTYSEWENHVKEIVNTNILIGKISCTGFMIKVILKN